MTKDIKIEIMDSNKLCDLYSIDYSPFAASQLSSFDDQKYMDGDHYRIAREAIKEVTENLPRDKSGLIFFYHPDCVPPSSFGEVPSYFGIRELSEESRNLEQLLRLCKTIPEMNELQCYKREKDYLLDENQRELMFDFHDYFNKKNPIRELLTHKGLLIEGSFIGKPFFNGNFPSNVAFLVNPPENREYYEMGIFECARRAGLSSLTGARRRNELLDDLSQEQIKDDLWKKGISYLETEMGLAFRFMEESGSCLNALRLIYPERSDETHLRGFSKFLREYMPNQGLKYLEGRKKYLDFILSLLGNETLAKMRGD